MSRRGLSLVLAVTCAVGACSLGGNDRGLSAWKVDQPNVTSATLTGSITEIWLVPWPEGPQKVAYRNTPAVGIPEFSERQFQEMVDVLGWPLPEPLPQPKRCDQFGRSYTIIVRLDSGQSQWFGPCERPIEASRLAPLFRW